MKADDVAADHLGQSPMPLDVLLPTLTSCAGLFAAVLTALRFNREDTSAAVKTARELVDGMRVLVDELEEALARARARADAAEARNVVLEAEIATLRAALAA